MFVIIGCMFTGIVAGVLLRKVNLGWLDKFIVFTIWLLLFLLGFEMGSDPEIVATLHNLGLIALIISLTATFGSCLAAWILARWCKMGDYSQDGAKRPISIWKPLKGSFTILAFFAAGCIIGYWDLFGDFSIPSDLSFYTLCVMIFSIGITIGHKENIFTELREFDKKILLLPIFTIVGTLVAVTFLAPLLPYRLTEILAVGSGQGYYSLSSVLITESKGAELGAIALLANVIREIATLLLAPLLPRVAGPLAPIAAGGATTADSTLPIIKQSSGETLAVVSIYHGFLVDFSVPFMVGLFCSI